MWLFNLTEGGDQEVVLAKTTEGTVNKGPKTRQRRLPASPELPMSLRVSPRRFKLALSNSDSLKAGTKGNDWFEVVLTLLLYRSLLKTSKEEPSLKPRDESNDFESTSGHDFKGNSEYMLPINPFPLGDPKES